MSLDDELERREKRLERICAMVIQDRAGRVRPMETAKLVQRKLYWLMYHCLFVWMLPCWILVCKGRKAGITTFVILWILLEVDETGKQAIIISQDKATSVYVLGIIKRALKFIDEEDRPVFEKDNDYVLQWRRGSGMIEVFTAGSKNAPRSRTPQIIHFTEAGHSDPDIMTALGGNIAPMVGNVFIQETTANQEDPLFFPFWKEAERTCELFFEENPDGSFKVRYEAEHDWNNWFPLFSGALDDEESRIPLKGPAERDSILETLNAEEREIVESGGPLEFIKWLRFIDSSMYKHDPAMRRQEHPLNATEAFQVGGKCRFNPAYMRQWVVEPNPLRGSVLRLEDWSRKVGFVPDEGGIFLRYKAPQKGHMYSIGLDTAEGIIREGCKSGDNSIMQVLDCETDELVAKWGGLVPEERCWQPLILIAVYYNCAFVVVETNSTGKIVAVKLMEGNRYPRERIYHRRDWDDKGINRKSRVPGFRTNQETRRLLVTRIAEAVTDWPLRVYDKQTRDEFMHFLYNDKGRVEAAPGWNDDHVMAAGLAIEGRRWLKWLGDAAPKPIDGGSLDFGRDLVKKREVRHRRRNRTGY